jgi:two-component system sensor histidine kinase UhpB
MADCKAGLSVLVVTGSAALRHTLSAVLGSVSAAEIVGFAADPTSAREKIPAALPDLVLLDADPRDADGREFLLHIAKYCPQCAVAVIAHANDRKPISDFLQAHGSIPTGMVIDPDDLTQLAACVERALACKDHAHTEHRLALPDGSARYLYDYVDYISSGHHEGSYSGLVHGIAERRRKNGRRQAEIERTTSTERFQSFVEQLPGLPYIANLDKDGSNVYVSPKIEELLGYSAEQWCKDPGLRIRQLHDDDRPRLLSAIADAIESNGGFSIDYRIRKPNGSIRWFHDEARVIIGENGLPLFLQGAILDITERKMAQEELEHSHYELRQLITALDSLRIEEQKRLAHEMHDDFGQMLAAMKMDISTLQQHLQQYLPQGDSKVVRQLSSINDLVDAMVASVRRIIADLPPKILEDVGLFSALEMMADNFQKRYQIVCHMQLCRPEPAFDIRVATAIYRMVQETLNNVAKHAQATRVDVLFDCSETHVTLSVIDNGRGIPGAPAKPGSFGLIGMRERVKALGGDLTIDSKEGFGTAVHITIPFDATLPSRHES